MAPARTPGRTPARRRQRSVRVTVAVALLAVATVAVLATLATRSALWIGAAAVLALLLAWVSLRIMWTEVTQSRREHAADRAATAGAYRSLFAERAAEHAEFTTAMTERLAQSQLSLRETAGERDVAVRRAQDAESRSIADAQRLVDAQQRLHATEQSLAAREAELAEAREAADAAIAVWDPASAGSGDADISRLITWAHDASASAPADQRKRA